MRHRRRKSARAATTGSRPQRRLRRRGRAARLGFCPVCGRTQFPPHRRTARCIWGAYYWAGSDVGSNGSGPIDALPASDSLPPCCRRSNGLCMTSGAFRGRLHQPSGVKCISRERIGLQGRLAFCSGNAETRKCVPYRSPIFHHRCDAFLHEPNRENRSMDSIRSS